MTEICSLIVGRNTSSNARSYIKKSRANSITFTMMILKLGRLLFSIAVLMITATSAAQNYQLEILGATADESKAIDSVGYVRLHASIARLQTESNAFIQKLKKEGWLYATPDSLKRINDTIFRRRIALGNRIKSIHIYIGKDAALKELAFTEENRDTIKLPFAQAETFMTDVLANLERKGYSLAKINLDNIRNNGTTVFADLIIETGNPRFVNDIVIQGYDKFPEGHKRSILRAYRNKKFSQTGLKKIHDDFARFRFVTQTKYPEILFTKDTTKVYVYLEKAKANRFDGFLGFSNDENEDGGSKLRLNGYLDLLLVNFLNTGEEFSLYWKSDGNEQKTFNVGIELPYIFKSRFGLRANLNIFRQDSTFQNTKTAIGLGYLFNYNTRIYLGYESTESSDILNTNNASISDFESRFATLTFNYARFREEDFLFPEQTSVELRTGAGSRDSKVQENAQFFGELNLMQNFYLNNKNVINVRSRNYYLQSNSYLVSELYRFGGINSVRGFNENSLQANIAASLLSEYRYILAPGIYAHSIIDYGWYRDETRNEEIGKNGSLLGLGFGFGLLTKNGLFNIVYANGSTNDQAIKLRNSIVHISFKASF